MCEPIGDFCRYPTACDYIHVGKVDQASANVHYFYKVPNFKSGKSNIKNAQLSYTVNGDILRTTHCFVSVSY